MGKGLANLQALISPNDESEEIQEVKSNKPITEKDKWAALASVEKSLSKQFKTTALVKMGSKVGQVMPSIGGDLPSFDYGVIGTGGLPEGRIIEWYGDTSGGKTTLALHYVAKEQARGNIVAYVDSEHSLDPSWMDHLGVDVDKLVIAQPDSLEQAVETVEALVDSGAVSFIVIDSVAAMTPQAELNGESGDVFMGLQARLVGQAMRKLRGKCSSQGVTLLFINQIRTNLGQMYGNPMVTPGGKSLKFFSSLRVEISKVGGEAGQIKDGNELIGHKIRLKCTKNKVGVPAKVTEIDLIYSKGIDTGSDMIQYAVNIGVIKKAGAWYSYGENKLGNGLTAASSYVINDHKLFEEIKEAVKNYQTSQKEKDIIE